MMRISFKKIEVETLLVALVLNANVLRFYLNISDQNMGFYTIYMLCIIILFYNHGLLFFKSTKMRNYAVLGSMLVIYAFVSCLWTGLSNLINATKFFVGIVLFVMIYSFDIKKINRTLNYVIIINIFYSLSILIDPMRIKKYRTEGGQNYLTLTLTLGMAVAISLTRMICCLYSKNALLSCIGWGMISMIYFVALTCFISRGPILLPILSVGIIIILISFKRKLKSVFVILFIILIGYFGIKYYVSHTPALSLTRMARLFENVEDESRLDIWKDSIQLIMAKHWYLIGGGVNSMRQALGYYPHNYFMQMIGEYGLLGIYFILSITMAVILGLVRFSAMYGGEDLNGTVMTTYTASATAMYLLFTFCKSFSIYDAYSLYISLGFCIKAFDELMHKGNIKLLMGENYNSHI